MVVVVDTGAWGQLAPMRKYLEPRVDRTLLIDHHLSGDVPAKWKYIDSTSAATCEIIAQLIDEIARHEHQSPNRMLDPIVSDALFVGIASDTGWFRFSNTRPFTHELAARLIRQGVDHAALYAQLEQGDRPEKLKLQIRALESLRLLANNTIAMMVLRASDFVETGAQAEETERLVDIPQTVATVQVVVLITEPPDEQGKSAPPLIRMSFRSKPGKDAVNVAELAAQFGGGGHARAAGAKVPGPLDVVVARVAEALDHVAAG
jgi:phosphoesterase RecJ-like protein